MYWAALTIRRRDVLWRGTKEEIEAETEKWLRENRENGMIIRSDCSLGRGMESGTY